MIPIHFPRLRLETLDDRITPTISFGGPQSFAVGSNPQSVAVADFNSDGRPDLVTADENDNTVSVRLNTTPQGAATITYADPQTFAVAAGPRSVAVGDFNGDGRPDIVTVHPNGYSVSVLMNTSGPPQSMTVTFAPRAEFAVGYNTRAVAVADFNADGRPDIAVASGNVEIRLNTTSIGAATPTFAAAQTVVSNVNVGSLAVADFDADGRPDIAYSDSNNTSGRFPPFVYFNFVAVRLNATVAGATTLTFGPDAIAIHSHDSPFSYTDIGIATGDFDGDGRIDIVANNYMSSARIVRNTTITGSGNATFANSQSFTVASFNNGRSVPAAVGDYDGDGRADLIFANQETSVSVLLNTTPTFSPTLSFATRFVLGTLGRPTDLAVADFNGDGRLDLATSVDNDTVTVHPNQSTDLAVTGPPLVGSFGDNGVWQLNRATGEWVQLTATVADAVAVAPNGNVVGSFGDNGVWYYQPAHGWYQINGNRARTVAVDGLGNVYASFDGYGTAIYRLANGWSAPLTSVAADRLVVNRNGQVAAHFEGYGLYTYTNATGWRFLDDHTISALAIGENGDVVVGFVGFGVNLWRETGGWVRLHDTDATSLTANANGSVVAAFVGGGVSQSIPATNTWVPLHTGTEATSVAMDLYGNVFLSLNGFGVYEYRPFTHQLWLRTVSTASQLSLG